MTHQARPGVIGEVVPGARRARLRRDGPRDGAVDERMHEGRAATSLGPRHLPARRSASPPAQPTVARRRAFWAAWA
jgi:hypothetical protein